MRVLVIGAGVIGSIYAARLIQAGHPVTLCARGDRLTELQTSGLILEDARTGQRTRHVVEVVEAPNSATSPDAVLVAVRRDQMVPMLPLLAGLVNDTVFFGNAAGITAQLAAELGNRAMFGFPAAGGVRTGAVVRYVQIRQQKTMLADPNATHSNRARGLAKILRGAGFPTVLSADAEAWLIAHAAFIVPIAFALYRVEVEPARLAADRALLTTMVRATREAFEALRRTGNREIPRNLRALYLLMPEPLAVRYWRRTLVSGRGELWFAGHTRAAPEEMTSLASTLCSTLHRIGRRAPHLEQLLAGHTV